MAVCVLVLPTVSLAQQGLPQGLISSKPVDYQSPGMHLGSFLLSSAAELAWEDNSNIFYLTDDEIGDSIIHARIQANINSDWNRHDLNIGLSADIGRYQNFENEDYEDWTLNLAGRLGVNRRISVDYTFFNTQAHESRSSPDDAGGLAPTELTIDGFGVGYNQIFNRLTAALKYKVNDTVYENNLDGDGNILNNQDRNRSGESITLRLSYEYSPQFSLFMSAASNELDYDQKFDRNGFQRSSTGNSLAGGVAWNMTDVLIGDLYLTSFRQKYHDPGFNNINGYGLGANLDWTPTRLTNVIFHFDTSPQETTQFATSGYARTLYSVRLQHEFRRHLLATLSVSYTDNKYESKTDDSLDESGLLTNSDVFSAAFALSYLMNRHVYLSGGYVYEEQDANSPDFKYLANRWFVLAGYAF